LFSEYLRKIISDPSVNLAKTMNANAIIILLADVPERVMAAVMMELPQKQIIAAQIVHIGLDPTLTLNPNQNLITIKKILAAVQEHNIDVATTVVLQDLVLKEWFQCLAVAVQAVLNRPLHHNLI
jgi:hypothetical protein